MKISYDSINPDRDVKMKSMKMTASELMLYLKALNADEHYRKKTIYNNSWIENILQNQVYGF